MVYMKSYIFLLKYHYVFLSSVKLQKKHTDLYTWKHLCYGCFFHGSFLKVTVQQKRAISIINAEWD